jgi:salicylate 5-hydroxylase large subunit
VSGGEEMTTPVTPGDSIWSVEGTHRVPYRIYTEPEIYRRELDRIFQGSAWNFVGLEAEIPNPGDYRTTRIGESSVIVVHGSDGVIRALQNKCAHRGLEVCQRSHGSVKTFQCPYHQWRYGLNGRLLGAPMSKGVNGQGGMPEDFKRSDHGLKALELTTRGGVIFASLGDPKESLEDYLGPKMIRWFDRVFDGRRLRVLGTSRQRIPANWKLMFENIKDPYHASLLHVFLVSFGLFRADNPSATEMDETGRHSVLTSCRSAAKEASTPNQATAEMASFRADLKLKDEKLLDIVKEFDGPETVVMQTIWPNLIVQQQANTLATRQIVPRAPDSFDLIWTFFGYADDDEAMCARRLRHANLMGPAGFVSMDDSEVMDAAQRGIAADSSGDAVVEMGGRGTEDQDHIVTETAIRAFYAYYRKVMDS